MFFTQTWLNSNIPKSAIELTGHYILQTDTTAVDFSRTRCGGLCIYLNKTWCTDTTIIGSHCSANLEYLMVKCRPFYLPREFTSTVVTAAYIPPYTNAKIAMKELHTAISKQLTLHPEAAFIIGGDFNHSNLKSVLPKFQQHVWWGQPEETRLWTMSTQTKAIPLPHLRHLSLAAFILGSNLPIWLSFLRLGSWI